MSLSVPLSPPRGEGPSPAGRPTARIILVLLAGVLNGWPALAPAVGGAAFLVPARASSPDPTPLFIEEVINPGSPHPMSHVASLTELPDGSLAAAWYAGSSEGAGDVSIYLSMRSAADDRWSPPRAIVSRESASRGLNRPIKKVGNAVLFADSAGALWLLYATVSVGGWSGSSLNLTRSTDRGLTWTAGRRLTLSPFFNVAELVKNRPVALSDGGWAVPIYHELIGRFPEVLWLREDKGRVRATKSRIIGSGVGFQPAIAVVTANRALAVLRAVAPARTVSVVRTHDAGRTWSGAQALDLPSPDSGLDAMSLADGRLLIAFNDSASHRDNLRLAVSADEGRTWARVATLAEEVGGDVSYPSLAQTRDGNVHVVYTWQRTVIRHAVFNVAWLDARRTQPR
jgi:predicted neuraminidase